MDISLSQYYSSFSSDSSCSWNLDIRYNQEGEVKKWQKRIYNHNGEIQPRMGHYGRESVKDVSFEVRAAIDIIYRRSYNIYGAATSTLLLQLYTRTLALSRLRNAEVVVVLRSTD